MKAFRNLAGNVIEIDVDTDPDGHPILPPDTTVDPRPEAQEGHYVTVVGKVWMQIPIPQPFVSFETKQAEAQKRLSKYKDWYLEQPIMHMDFKFDADEMARARLTQAIVMTSVNGYLASAWITYDNGLFPLNSLDDLKGIANAVQVAFANRFFEMSTIREQIASATDETQLSAIEIPEVPQFGMVA